MNIERIVEEVIRRIKALENRHNLLIIYHEATSIDLLEEIIGCMDKSYLKIGIIGFKDPEPLLRVLATYDIEVLNMIDGSDYIHMPYIMARYDAMLISSLTLGEMYNISVLNLQTPLEKLAMNWMFEKGRVYAIDTLNLKESVVKKPLVEQVNILKGRLKDLGIEWIGKTCSSVHKVSGLLTREHLLGYEGGRLVVDQSTVITPMAREYAKAQNISIERK